MYVVSRYGGRGRSIYTSIDNGTVNVKDRRRRVRVKVRNGIAVEETTWTKSECRIMRYGRDLTIKKGRRITYQEFYEPGTLRSIRHSSLWKRHKDYLVCGTKGTLECFSTSSGSCGKEVFTYQNRVVAYVATKWRKKLVIYRPDGKLWMIVKGKTHVSRYPIAEQLKKPIGAFDFWRFINGTDWDLTIYNADGITIVTQGHYRHQQKEGKWLEDAKIRYYMAGVKVSRTLCEENPAQWNPHEILRIPNAQLRCSLLGRFGYDKLLEKVESRVLESSYDGGQLIEINAGSTRATDGNLDKTMRLIKVICPSTKQVYVLRVPPDIDKFEQARQWTFGLQQASIRDGVQLDFLKET